MVGAPMAEKVLLTDHAWSGVEIEQRVLEEAGLELVEAPAGADEDTLLELGGDVSAIMTNWAPVSRKMIEEASRLRAVVRMGVGLDNIDLQAASDRGCVVSNVPDYCVEEVSDHVVGFIHSWARGIAAYDREVRGGEWSPGKRQLRRVSELTVGMVGLGRIGRRSVSKLGALGCRVLGLERPGSPSFDGIELVSRSRMLSLSDVVVLHVPLNEATYHLVDDRFLAAMRPEALLVNVSRGGVVDTDALIAGLRVGRPAWAALDVLESEPEVPPELRELDNVTLTPHVAFSSDVSVRELRERASLEVVHILSGDRPTNRVELPPPRQ